MAFPCAAAAFSFGCARFHDRAAAAPYRLVTVVVTASGSGRAASAASGSSAPCFTGLPIWPGRRGGGGRRNTRLVPSRPVTCTGRSRSSQARRACCVPGVEDHHDVRVAVFPVPGGCQPRDHVADLGRGHRSQVVVRPQPDRVPAAGSRTCGRVPARRRASTASPGSSARCSSPARSSGRTSGPGRGRVRPAASCSHRRPAGSARRATRAAAARTVPAAAARRGPRRSSARRRGRRARGGTPAPGIVPRASAPALACTAPRRTPRTARPGAGPATGTAHGGTPPAAPARQPPRAHLSPHART